MGEDLGNSLVFFLRTESLMEAYKHGRLSVHMCKDSQWQEDLNFS